MNSSGICSYVFGINDIYFFQSPNKNEAQKALATLAVTSFDIPGDPGFPLNAFMTKPSNRSEAGGRGHNRRVIFYVFIVFVDQMRQYFTQLRQEIGQRLVEKVFVDDKPSKVCLHKDHIAYACTCSFMYTL